MPEKEKVKEKSKTSDAKDSKSKSESSDKKKVRERVKKKVEKEKDDDKFNVPKANSKQSFPGEKKEKKKLEFSPKALKGNDSVFMGSMGGVFVKCAEDEKKIKAATDLIVEQNPEGTIKPEHMQLMSPEGDNLTRKMCTEEISAKAFPSKNINAAKRVNFIATNPKDNKMFINVRWPPGVIAAMYNLLLHLQTHKKEKMSWVYQPLNTLVEPRDSPDIYGKKSSSSILCLFSTLLDELKVDNLDVWWMEENDGKVGLNPDGYPLNLFLFLEYIQSLRKLTIHSNDIRTFMNPAFDILYIIMFNLAQTIGMLVSESTSENLLSYLDPNQQPPKADIIRSDIIAYSRSEWSSDGLLNCSIIGKAKSELPQFDLDIIQRSTDEDGVTKEEVVNSFKAEDFGEIKNNTIELGWEKWAALPTKHYYRLQLKPIDKKGPIGSMSASKLITQWIYKPLSTPVDFDQILDVNESIVFAECWGTGPAQPICYRYRTPIAIFAKANFILQIKNDVSGATWKIPEQQIKDLDLWFFQNTGDRGTGYGNLKYKGGGELRNNRPVNCTWWPNGKTTFSVSMLASTSKKGKGK